MTTAGRHSDGRFTGPWMMLIFAAILGFFGFAPTFNHISGITGEFLLFVAIYEWTLKGAAIAFLISGGIAFFRPVVAEWLFGVSGILASLGLVASAALDLRDTQHLLQDPMLTFLFAALIAIGAGASIRDALAAGRVPV